MSEFNLQPSQVYIRWANLNDLVTQWEDFTGILSADERERSQRFHFPQHQHHFVLARGILRLLLGQYLNLKPQQVQFAYSSRGKPYLAFPVCDLHFNLSHSQGQAVYGFARHTPLGIDIESIRPLKDLKSLAKRFFLPAEYQHILQTPMSEQPLLFFRYWTYKEAYLKALGEGLAGLEEAAIHLDEKGARIIDITGKFHPNWSLYSLPSPVHTVAAVAILGQSWQIQYQSVYFDLELFR